MGSNQLFERFFRGEIAFNALERWYPLSLRQFQSCIAVDNNAAVCDYDGIADARSPRSDNADNLEASAESLWRA